MRPTWHLFLRMVLLLFVAGTGCLIVSNCRAPGGANKGSHGKRGADPVREGQWKISRVMVSTQPAGVSISIFDPVTKSYRMEGSTPAEIIWYHHCMACNDTEPVAPVLLDYEGKRIKVIPEGYKKGKEFAVGVYFSGDKPVVRKGVLYDPEVYLKPETRPSYPGGDDAYQDFIMHNVYYPAKARLKGIEGKVYACFVVEQDGSLTNLKILNGIGGGCDEEVLEIIRKMRPWIPGTVEGRPVRSIMAIMISFTLTPGNYVKSVYYWR